MLHEMSLNDNFGTFSYQSLSTTVQIALENK